MSGFEVIEGGLGGGWGRGGGSWNLHPRRRKQTNKAGLLKKKSKSGQRKAARFCLSNYNQTAIVSDMLNELEWEMKKQQEANCGDKHREI